MSATKKITATMILIACGLLVAGIQFLQPLTAGGPDDPRLFAQRDKAHQFDEYAYCRENMPGVDCGCFSNRASQVLAKGEARVVSGARYADKWDLALTQAGQSCR